MGVWSYRGIEVLKSRGIEVWRCRGIEVWRYRCMEVLTLTQSFVEAITEETKTKTSFFSLSFGKCVYAGKVSLLQACVQGKSEVWMSRGMQVQGYGGMELSRYRGVEDGRDENENEFFLTFVWQVCVCRESLINLGLRAGKVRGMEVQRYGGIGVWGYGVIEVQRC